MPLITSNQNPKISALKKLISSASYRKETGLYVTEGFKLFSELLREKADIVEVYATPSAADELSRKYGFSEVILISDSLSAGVSDQKTPEGVFAVCKRPDRTGTPGIGKYLILDRIQDVGNMGTIIRTADAFSLSGVIVSPDSCDVFSPKVLRTSMGSVLRVNIIEYDPLSAVKKINEMGGETYTTVLSADKNDMLGNITFGEFSAVVIGNEGNGVSKEVSSECNRKLTIPMTGKAESLNAAVAGGIIAYEMGKKK